MRYPLFYKWPCAIPPERERQFYAGTAENKAASQRSELAKRQQRGRTDFGRSAEESPAGRSICVPFPVDFSRYEKNDPRSDEGASKKKAAKTEREN